MYQQQSKVEHTEGLQAFDALAMLPAVQEQTS